jgi:hypothetical protein
VVGIGVGVSVGAMVVGTGVGVGVATGVAGWDVHPASRIPINRIAMLFHLRYACAFCRFIFNP